MGKDFGVTFLGLWWAEFHAEKEMGAKMVGLPGSAVFDSFQKIAGTLIHISEYSVA